MNDIEIKERLYGIKRKRTTVHVVMILLISLVFITEYTSLIPEHVTFFVFSGGILALIPYMIFVSVSTCPKCNNNYFGGFPPRINRKKCAYCGIELKEAIKPNNEN